MELTVKRSGMPCCENVFAYLMPAEEAVETVVPDTMPDVERILFTEGIASIRSKEVLDGAVNITGSVNATVLYVPEGGEGTSSLEATIPLSVELDAPDVTSDSLAVALLTVVSMDSRLLNPRKILVRAVVNVFVLAFNRTELGISSGLEGEGADSVETLSETSSLSPVVCVREKTFVVSDEYTLQPGLLPIGELLWHSTQIVPGNVRSVGARIIFNGTVRLNIIYSAAGSGELSTAAFESEFSQMLDAETDLTSPDCDVYSMLTAEYVEPVTLAGGERGISAEYHIVSQCVCTDSVRVECLTDCYSNTHLLDVGRTQTELNAAQRRSTVRASASETLPASPAPVNIVRVICRAGSAESENGVLRCPVAVTALYTASDGQVYAASRRFTCEAPAELAEGEQVLCVRVLGTECSSGITQGGIDVRVQADFEVVSARRCQFSQISSVGDMGAVESEELPSVTVIRAGEGDTLWTLGKRYHSTAGLIRDLNSLDEGANISGRVLLIPRAGK